ncbi:MAG: hypothetical protein HZA54_11935, partial [Planctomycetes bacterium]|nr:hypothetical protein [Planctomycetota bacterium]
MPNPQDLWIAQAALKQTGLGAEQIRDALRRHSRAGETHSFADALVAMGLVQPAIKPVLAKTATEMRLDAEEEALSRRLLELGLVVDRVVRPAARNLHGRELSYREGHNLVGELIGAGVLEPSPGLSELVSEVRVAVEAGVRESVMRGLGIASGSAAAPGAAGPAAGAPAGAGGG